MVRNMEYGKCSSCGSSLQPVWFEEEERKVVHGSLIATGRKRTACSHLECPVCLKKEAVDDTFDGEWYKN